MDIIKAISDWPVIVQGALGSGLFWIILELGQRSTKSITSKLGNDQKTANSFSFVAHAAPPSAGRDTARFFAIYGAVHYGIKGAIVTALSAALVGFLDVFASVGYLMAVYFFFRALSYVPHSSTHGNKEEQAKRFQEWQLEIHARNRHSTTPNLVTESPKANSKPEA